MTEHAASDLETVPPLPPGPASGGGAGGTTHPNRRGPVAALLAALVVVALVVGFGVATIVLNARDSSTKEQAAAPATTVPPNRTIPGNPPSTTTPSTLLPTDPRDSVLAGLIVGQRDVPAADTVNHLDHGADTTVATLDLCNGTFPSEALRTARRQVAVTDQQGNIVLSTEAVLYAKPATGTQAFAELRSVRAKCPSTPVTSPVGEGTATTTFRAPPDGAWPQNPSVERLAYDFVTTDATTHAALHSVAVYLRRGRVLMGVYFAQPDGPQIAVEGHTSIAGIVSVFEARLAQLPVSVVQG